MRILAISLTWNNLVWSDQLWIVTGALFLIAGLIGCFVKKMPGTPLTWASLLMLQLLSEPPFSTLFILFMAAITIIMIMADYVAPVLTEKWLKKQKPGVIIGNVLKFMAGLYMAYEFIMAVTVIN